MTKTNSLEAIRTQKRMLVLSGMWPVASPSLFYKIRHTISWACVIGLIIMQIVVCYYEYRAENYESFVATASLMVPVSNYLIKEVIFQLKRKQFKKMLSLLKAPIFLKYPEDLDAYMQRGIINSRRVSITYQSVCFTSIFFFNCKPFFTSNYELTVNVSMFNLGGYLYVLQVWQLLGLIYAAYNNSCLDTIATSFMGVSASYFDILNQKVVTIRELATGKTDGDINDEDDAKINKMIKECVQLHSSIIEFTSYIEENFSLGFLVQLLGSILVICNIGFQLAHTSSPLNYIIYITFFAAMMTQLALYCWYGNELTLKSSKLRDACYMSDWYNCGPTVRKSLYIIMERSKRPLYVTAGKFTILSLASLTAVLRSSYSYFALMQRLYGKTTNEINA